jgi:hypothetical protein
MKPNGISVYWRGEVVGYMLTNEVDNFNIYGKWKPAASPLTHEFLSRLAYEEELHIEVAGTKSWLTTEPVEHIEYRFCKEGCPHHEL